MSKQSRRPNRAARHQKQPAVSRGLANSKTLYWVAGLLVVAAAIVGVTFAGGGSSSAGAALPVGSTAPAFSGTDVLTGQDIDARQLAGQNVLYYFSSGSTCQACMVQAQALQQSMPMLERAHLRLVMVTNDSATSLRSAASGYQLSRLPLVADPQGTMTERFGAVGGGMNMGPHMADHTFILVGKNGKVLFHKDFPNMWVTTANLLGQLPQVS